MNSKTTVWKYIFVIVCFLVLSLLVFYKALNVFFFQDDFILINHFSQNNLQQDIKNVFIYPSVSHWRPIHNLYFLISGNLFGRFYPGYHAFTLIIHVVSAIMIFTVLKLLVKNTNASLLATIVYAVHPSHFVSIFWISGSSTTIGFLFLISSFYLYLKNKKSWALVLFVLSFLASEAMVVGAAIFTSYEFLIKRKIIDIHFLLKVISIASGFLFIRFLFLTSKTIFETFPFEISKKTVDALFYYFLRTLGIAETSQDTSTSIILILWFAAITIAILKIFRSESQKFVWFFALSGFIGLFPFILIPSHLSPHYLNISIWAFASVISFGFLHLRPFLRLILILVFVFMSILNIQLTYKNNWVVDRSAVAKQYIEKIKTENPPAGSLLVFDNSPISTSSEAYFALGTGKALDFWFGEKNYKTCFSAFENCSSSN